MNWPQSSDPIADILASVETREAQPNTVVCSPATLDAAKVAFARLVIRHAMRHGRSRWRRCRAFLEQLLDPSSVSARQSERWHRLRLG